MHKIRGREAIHYTHKQSEDIEVKQFAQRPRGRELEFESKPANANHLVHDKINHNF